MTRGSDSRDVRNCIVFSHAVSVLAVLFGTLTLLGWLLGLTALAGIVPGSATMKPNTAICLVLAGLSLWLIQLRRGAMSSPTEHGVRVARVLSGVVALVGLLTLAEYIFHLKIGLDELFFSRTLPATGVIHPGRMAAATALGFLLLGASLLLATTRNVYVSQSVGLLTALDGCVACLGYLLGAPSLYAISAYSSMALHTAIMFFLLGLATLAARPESGFMTVVTSENIGGMMVRRVLPIIILLVLLLGWLRRQGQVLGLYHSEFGIALLILVEVVTFVVLLWLSGMRLNRLDQERRRSESRNLLLAAVVESSEDAILSKDLSGTITSWNPSAQRLYGYSAAEIIGKSVSTLMPQELHDEATRFLRMIARGQLVTTEDTIRRRKDGSLVHVSLVISPVRDQEGQIVGASAIAHDITERKRAEEELRKSEDRYRDLVEHSQDLICTHDLSGKLLSANQAPARVLGYNVAELLKIPLREIIAPGFREQFDEYLVRIEKNGADKGFMAVLTRTGERRIWEYDNTLRTEGVASPIVRGMAHDVTERVVAEKRLRESEERLRLLVQSANVGLWDWNLITNEVYFSPEWKSQIGYAEDEISNRFQEWESRVHPDDLDGALQKIRAFLANPQGQYEVEFRFRHKNDSYRWIYAQGDVLRDTAGKSVRMLGCHLDITERKQAEEALRTQSEQLRALSVRLQQIREEERTRVARDLHDQIGQILTAVKMDMDWVTKRLPDGEPQIRTKLGSTLDLVRDAIQSLRSICTQLRPGVLDDLGLAAAIEWQAAEFASRTGIQCEVSVPTEDLDLGTDRSTAIFRILQEALTNVARHAKAKLVRVSLTERNGEVLLVVQDDGKGIRQSDLTASKGSLGLLGMRERVQACGGDLQIWGEAGTGTTLAVNIPWIDRGQKESNSAHSVGR